MADHEHHELDPIPENATGWHRTIRIVLGLALFALGVSGLFDPSTAAALRVASIVPLVSAGFGWCPVNQLLGIQAEGQPAR